MGKNQKGKKEEKWEDKAGSLSQERKIREKEIEEKGDIHLKIFISLGCANDHTAHTHRVYHHGA